MPSLVGSYSRSNIFAFHILAYRKCAFNKKGSGVIPFSISFLVHMDRYSVLPGCDQASLHQKWHTDFICMPFNLFRKSLTEIITFLAGSCCRAVCHSFPVSVSLVISTHSTRLPRISVTRSSSPFILSTGISSSSSGSSPSNPSASPPTVS